MTDEKNIDESWKDAVSSEKDLLKSAASVSGSQSEERHPVENMEITFFNYLTSLVFQAMIFLGELPHPLQEDKLEVNLPQAKMIIDTLSMLRDKTKGNLNKEEEDFLNASVYELQMKFVEITQKSGGIIQNG